LKPNDVVDIVSTESTISTLALMLSDGSDSDSSEQSDLEDAIIEGIRTILRLSTPDEDSLLPLVPIVNAHLRIDTIEDENSLRDNFRFESREQLHELRIGFHFEDRMTDSHGKAFAGDEILLAGLYRLTQSGSFSGVGWVNMFGWNASRASIAFDLFLDHMIKNWRYLIQDNLE
jgi:hypothetical protein